MSKGWGIWTGFLGLVFASRVWSVPLGCETLNILHTNDLHSHLDRTNNPELGSFAAVKATLDRLKGQAQTRGDQTLVLDAGDFLEGGKFFFADKGADVFQVMNAMGYDAIALGNHDWLAGTDHLDWISSFIPLQFKFLAANFYVDSSLRNLKRTLLPYTSFQKGRIRVAVIGLTTDELFYRWRASDNRLAWIGDPISTAAQLVPELKRNHDIVIALTHLGVNTDVSLVTNVPGIDIVVGGHSHTELQEATFVRNSSGTFVPIVQTGYHGQKVGTVSLQVCSGGGPVIFQDYHLVPVRRSEGIDSHIEHLVEQTKENFHREFGTEWLGAIVGESEIPLASPNVGKAAWHSFVARAQRQEVGADYSLDLEVFGGIQQPAGPVTREMILDAYPRTFDLRKKTGWNIWLASVPGWVIRSVLGSLGGEHTFHLSGQDFPGEGSGLLSGSRLNIDPLHNYKIALPEGLARGAYRSIPATRLLIQNARDTGIPIWTAIERQFNREGGVLRQHP